MTVARRNPSTVIFILLSIAASGLNYITYPALAHLLPSGEYGDITVALSLLTQMSTFLSSIVAITIGLSKKDDPGSAKEKIELLQSSLLRLFIVISVIFGAVSPLVMHAVHIPTLYALPLCLMLLASIPIAIISGHLNGLGKMTKLGIITAASALLQFGFTAIIAILTRNGFWALAGMGIAQLASISFAYIFFGKRNIPNVAAALKRPQKRSDPRQTTTRLILYTFVASLAIMCVNIAQIADLLIVRSRYSSDITFYTDMYVLSRSVFFAGMIFIWPFLAMLDLEIRHLNRKPLTKVVTYFVLITLFAIVGLHVLGGQILGVLFGTHYTRIDANTVGTLSIIYKCFFLIITAVVLYFVVLQRATAIWLAACATIIIGGFSFLAGHFSNIQGMLYALDMVTGLVTIVCLLTFVVTTQKSKS